MSGAFPFRLYLVVSAAACKGRDLVEVTEAAIKGGVDLVQLREKDLGVQAFLDNALHLQEMLVRYNVPLIINDTLEVAKRSHAYGIHVGNNDMPPLQVRAEWDACRLLGYSIEYRGQLLNEQTAAADCLGISPVFKSGTKQDTVTEWGLDGLRAIRAITSKPLIAIGNMNASNAYAAIKAGADCIAVVSAICAATDPAKAAYEIRNQLEKAI
jgi:thiamine-phosphate pyrophosphorylase